MIDIAASIAAYDTVKPPFLKTPSDIARYEEILRRTGPGLVIETGTGYGASAQWFAEHGCEVVTIDNTPDRCQIELPESVTRITGSSVDLTDLVSMCQWTVYTSAAVIVSLDSDHATNHVAQELAFYPSLVKPGGYLVIEDTIFRYIERERLAQGDPLAAVEAWDHVGFEPATDIEDMFADTQNPGGWWRRVG